MIKDLETKDIILACSSIVPGNPRQTKHAGTIPYPKVAEEYLKSPASLDIHNHYRCGSTALEDIPHEKINRCLTDINRCLTDIFRI